MENPALIWLKEKRTSSADGTDGAEPRSCAEAVDTALATHVVSGACVSTPMHRNARQRQMMSDFGFWRDSDPLGCT